MKILLNEAFTFGGMHLSVLERTPRAIMRTFISEWSDLQNDQNQVKKQ